MMLVGGSRFAERVLARAFATFRDRDERRRTLLVGAGRSGPEPAARAARDAGRARRRLRRRRRRLRGRRLQGVPVLGSSDEIERVLAQRGPTSCS